MPRPPAGRAAPPRSRLPGTSQYRYADRARLFAAGKASLVAARLFEELPRHPVVTITGVVKLLETTKPTAAKAIALLEEVGVLSETTGRKRDRTFSYAKYLDCLRIGTELR